MSEAHQGWIASMSDSSSVFQNDDSGVEEMTSWQHLRHRCLDDGELHITQLQLQTGGQTLVAMPNADGYVAFYEAKKSLSNMQAPAKHYQGIGAVFGDLVFITITNHQGTFWSDVRTLASMRPHCQLKPADARRRQDERPVLESFKAPDETDPDETGDYNTS